MQNKLHTKKAHSTTEKLGSLGPLGQRLALTPRGQFCYVSVGPEAGTGARGPGVRRSARSLPGPRTSGEIPLPDRR